MKQVVLLLLVLYSVETRAESARRVAVVVGHNTAPDRTPLRYAESDAAKLARVLVELGGVASDHLFLLQGRGEEDVLNALGLAKERLEVLRKTPEVRTVLIFYYSGHSNGSELQLGPDRLPFRKLKETLTKTGADVRLAIIDACNSGALVQSRAGHRAAPFAIRIDDQLESKGDVFLTSSAADELALESEELKSGYFSHHLVSGLRGAADDSKDGRVTLAEAYRYSYDRTVASSADTIAGTHHPVYDYRLSGKGELILSWLSGRVAALVVPTDADRVLVTQLSTGSVVSELTSGSARTIALAAGRYAIRMRKGQQTYAGRVELNANESREIDWAQLIPVQPDAAAERGGESPVLLSASASASPGYGDPIAVAAGVRAAFESSPQSGWQLAVMGSRGSGDLLTESSVLVRGGVRLGLLQGPIEVAVAFEAGPGVVWQIAPETSGGQSWLFVAGPRLQIRLPLGSIVRLSLEGEAMATLSLIDNRWTPRFVPAGLLGLAVSL